jgi:hypoxanthine phosphoribosyltransferase
MPQVHDKNFVPFISSHEIKDRVQVVAAEISKDYQSKVPLFISILNGSFMFAADLFRQISIPAEISFIKLASYRGTTSTGHVITAIGLDADIKGRDIIIIEDIIDTGNTMHQFLPQIKNMQPASLTIAVLLHKPDATLHQVPIDYCCFSIPDKFVVGYGLDYDGHGRNLDAIYQLA